MLSSLLTAGAVTAFSRRHLNDDRCQQRNDAECSTRRHRHHRSDPNWVAVAAAVEPSVVSVSLRRPGRLAGEGSGVILDKQGQVLTNNHVVAGAANGGRPWSLTDGRIYAAAVVGTDPSTDLAVIGSSRPPNDLVPAAFGDSAAVKVGDPVMAVGNPLGPVRHRDHRHRQRAGPSGTTQRGQQRARSAAAARSRW